MSEKKLSSLEVLEQKHVEAIAVRRAAIEAATQEMRDAEKQLHEARARLATLQREQLTASFAYDAERARLVEAGLTSARAA